jgi:protein-disulfide isomerase
MQPTNQDNYPGNQDNYKSDFQQIVQPDKKNNFMVPIAIILAGAMIAGALFFSRGGFSAQNNSQTAAAAASNSQQTSAQAAQNAQMALANVAPVASTDHLLGETNAPIVLIEYSDLECPFCKEFQITMQTIMNTYGKNGQLAWVYRNFPLYQTLHPKALNEAEAAECSNELGGNVAFWKYITEIYQVTPSNNGLDPAELPKVASDIGLDVTAFNTCLNSGKYQTAVEQEYQNALKAGGQGTPYVVLLLKTPLSSTQEQAVTTAMQNALQQLQPGAQLPAGFITYSADGSRIAWDGAFPIQMVQAALDTILGK